MAERHFAFLRAINTGKRRLTNDQLLAPFVDMGFSDVAAYQAAGNVTFRADAGTLSEADVEVALADAYGFDVPTFLRSAIEMEAIVRAQPFAPKAVAASSGKVQVTLLRKAPSGDQLVALESLVPAEDQVRVVGREWYWLPVAGISTSAMPVGQIERVLGEMTMRTLGTLQRMAAKFGG
jgi:uncharacterized protein (DUF1697 family)